MKNILTAILIFTQLSCTVSPSTDTPTETSTTKETTPATPESIKKFKGNWVLHNEGVKDTVILDFGETSYVHNAILGNVNDSNFSDSQLYVESAEVVTEEFLHFDSAQ